MKPHLRSERSKAFWYGALSVLTFGRTPSYLDSKPAPRIESRGGSGMPPTGMQGLQTDFRNVANDIAYGIKTATKPRQA